MDDLYHMQANIALPTHPDHVVLISAVHKTAAHYGTASCIVNRTLSAVQWRQYESARHACHNRNLAKVSCVSQVMLHIGSNLRKMLLPQQDAVCLSAASRLRLLWRSVFWSGPQPPDLYGRNVRAVIKHSITCVLFTTSTTKHLNRPSVCQTQPSESLLQITAQVPEQHSAG